MFCRHTVRVLLFILVGGLVLPASRCNYHVHNGTSAHSGPSSEIAPAGPSISWTPPSVTAPGPGTFFTLLNAQRNAVGAPSLIYHDGLKAAAVNHSQDMSNRNYLDLVSPDGYDVFQSLVSLNPPISFDDSAAVVYQVPNPFPGPAAVIAMLQSIPAVWATLMDPTMTHYGGGSVPGVVVPTISFETIILGRNVTPP